MALLSVAFAAVLVVASVYYGSGALAHEATKAAASTVISQAQQIAAANVLYKADNASSSATKVSDLVPDYLKAAPTMPANIADADLAIDGTTGIISVEISDKSTCLAVDKTLGGSTITAATASDAADLQMALDGAQYGCFSNTDSYYFAYQG